VAVSLAPIALISTNQQERPTFRAGVEYVAVDVVVTDRADRPVTDLTIDDFEIREEGRVQAITDFTFVSVPPAGRSVDLSAPAGPPHDVAANPAPSDASRAFAFVVDDGGINASDLVPLKRTLTDLLAAASPRDQIAVIYLQRSDLSQDFTDDLSLLTAAVDRATEAVGLSLGSGDRLRRIRFVSDGLQNVVSTMASAPHARRAVVFLSSGSSGEVLTPEVRPLSSGSIDGFLSERAMADAAIAEAHMRAAYERAIRANVPIYTLDPHGLASPESVFDIGMIASPGQRRALERTIRHRLDFLLTLAENTGGRGFVHQSDLQAAVDAIMTENGSYYLLGYYPEPYDADGEFHEVDVRVKRPGLRVRARSGYLAPEPMPDVDPERRVLESLGDGLPHGDIQLRAFGAPVAPGMEDNDRARAVLAIEVTYPDRESAGARAATEALADELRIAMLAIDPDARVMASQQRTLEVPLAGVGNAPFRLLIDEVLEVPRGKLIVRIGVSSRLLGRIGTVHLPLQVDALAGEDLAVTPLLLGLADGGAARVARAESIAGLVPFQPTTDRAFTTDQTVRVFARAFARAPDDLAATLVLRRDRADVRAVPLDVESTGVADNARDLTGSLPLAGLAPGNYVLSLTARSASGREVTREVVFDVR